MTAQTWLALLIGACVIVLLMVMYAVARPWWIKWRYRRAVAYRAVAGALRLRYPGFPGCICFPGDRHRLQRTPFCAAKKHRK